MQGESDKEVSKVGAAMVGTEFTKFEDEKQARFNVQSREFEKYTWKLLSSVSTYETDSAG
jgi:hypothetical protein